MLSINQSSVHHFSPVSAPWFAQPVVSPRMVRIQEESSRSVSPISDEGSCSFYPSRDEEHKKSTSSLTKLSDEPCLPSDPRSWMREDVQAWIRYMSRIHGLPSVQADRFLMNGKALCLMTMEMFCQRVPLGGKMLYKDFQLRLSTAMYGL